MPFPAGIPALGWDSWISFKKNTAYPTPAAPTPTPGVRDFYARVVRIQVPADRDLKTAQGMSGPGVRNHYAGRFMAQGSMTIEAHYTSLARLLKLALAGPTSPASGYTFQAGVPVAGANTHVIQSNHSKVLDSFDCEVFLGDVPTGKCFLLQGCIINDIVINFTEGEQVLVEIQYACWDVLSNVTPISTSPSIPTDRFMLSWHLKTTVVGQLIYDSIGFDALSFRLHINNGMSVNRFLLRKNLVLPVRIQNRVIDGSFGGELVDVTFWEKFKAIDTGSLIFTLESDEIVTGAQPYASTFSFPDTILIRPTIDAGDPGVVPISFDWQARGLSNEGLFSFINADTTYA